MKARTWKLPGVQDLTKDQDEVLARPTQGQHLIIGGPGTGKTVVTVMRAIEFQRQKVEYVFLVYNHMLHQASQQMADGQLKSCTYMSWFYKKFRCATGKCVPQLKPYLPDWEECIRLVSEISTKSFSPDEKECLIIDEGQDMPPDFFQVLIRLGYENFFVAADQNQSIWADKNSSRQDLEDELAIDTPDVMELRDNYRNNNGVARLARAFYTGDPASPAPNLPRRKKDIHIPKLYIFQNQSGIDAIISNAIVRYFRDHSQKLIGVITPNNGVREKYFNALKKAMKSLDANQGQIYTYSFGDSPGGSMTKHNVRFDRGGIVVLNAQSCKGLEFDTVVLADIHEHIINRNDQDAIKKLFYVMVSRARDQVFMLMKHDPHNLIHDILPEDESVLQRKSIETSHG